MIITRQFVCNNWLAICDEAAGATADLIDSHLEDSSFSDAIRADRMLFYIKLYKRIDPDLLADELDGIEVDGDRSDAIYEISWDVIEVAADHMAADEKDRIQYWSVDALQERFDGVVNKSFSRFSD